jgi:hypothetical protein
MYAGSHGVSMASAAPGATPSTKARASEEIFCFKLIKGLLTTVGAQSGFRGRRLSFCTRKFAWTLPASPGCMAESLYRGRRSTKTDYSIVISTEWLAFLSTDLVPLLWAPRTFPAEPGGAQAARLPNFHNVLPARQQAMECR